ncbi:MAG: hypothetical protein GY943_12950 [Chloroflexi bacterium]|nr:hypothetical protein [Chloroflexota bacterium]
MKSIKVSQLIKRGFDTALGHVIYVVRDGRFIFYVGQSKRDVVTRFHEHLQKPSRLGQIIKINQPNSHHWDVEFYTLADCRPFIAQKSLFPMQAWEHFDMDMAEIGMIKQMKPIINLDFNPNPTQLPEIYKGHHILNQPTPQQSTYATSPQHRIWLNRMSLQGWTYKTDTTGQITWSHSTGAVLSDNQMAPFRDTNQTPPSHDLK